MKDEDSGILQPGNKRSGSVHRHALSWQDTSRTTLRLWPTDTLPDQLSSADRVDFRCTIKIHAGTPYWTWLRDFGAELDHNLVFLWSFCLLRLFSAILHQRLTSLLCRVSTHACLVQFIQGSDIFPLRFDPTISKRSKAIHITY